MSTDTSKTGNANVIWFYLVFLLFVIGEGAIVGGILYAAEHWIHCNGTLLALAMFVVGASLLSLLELRLTSVGQHLHDPLLRAACWFQRRFGFAGLLFNSVVLGSLAASVALKRENCSNRVVLGILAGVIYSSVWVPLFTLVWR
jgi:hypothetical protein